MVAGTDAGDLMFKSIVVAFAIDRNADLIVCGSRGFGRMKSLLLGSTSHKIAQLAQCSCLTVK
jgi:nucleotide-binding universal stress UspA family protein